MTIKHHQAKASRGNDKLESWGLAPEMHPELTEFAAYWQSKRGPDGGYPRFEDIDPVDIASLMPGVVIIKQAVKPDGTDDFSYVYVGANHYEANGLDLTDRYLSDVYPAEIVEEAMMVWREVLKTGRIHYWGRPNPLPNREIVSYERVLMPLADANGDPNMLIGHWVWQ